VKAARESTLLVYRRLTNVDWFDSYHVAELATAQPAPTKLLHSPKIVWDRANDMPRGE